MYRSIGLFVIGMTLHLFATTSMGIFIGTAARSMPQMGLLMIIILLPLQMLSGGMTPRESMPEIVQYLMLAAPTTHFVSLAQTILYHGADFGIVWPEFLTLFAIGGIFSCWHLLVFAGRSAPWHDQRWKRLIRFHLPARSHEVRRSKF